MKRKFYLLLPLFFLSLIAYSQVKFTVIPPRGAETGRNFKVTFRLENGNANEPRIGEIIGCRFIFGPATSTSHSMTIVNGKQSSTSSVEYSYTYSTDSAGVYTIPPATVTVDGKLYKTEATKFEVYKSNAPKGQNKTTTHNGVGGTLGSSTSISKEDVFIRMIPTRTSVYEQEPIECTIKLYTKYRQIQNFKAVSQPNFDGCLIEEIPVQPALDEVEEYNGQTYSTAVLKKVIIFPQKSGRLKLNSGKYDITVTKYERINSFFGPQLYPVGEEEVHVNPGDLSIDVKPLPAPAPMEFNGAVGKFGFSSKLSSNKLRTNEAATLTYTISGTGNIRYIKEPEVDFPEEFEQYSPKAEINARVNGASVQGTVTIEYTFVPQAPGDFTIPGGKFVYFDPSTKEYVTIPIESYKVNVARGAGVSVNATTDQISLNAQMTDILHIKPGASNLKLNHSLLVYSGLYWVIVACLIILFCAGIYWKMKQEKTRADVTGQRIAKAGKVARRRLKSARAALNTGDGGELFYSELLKAMWGYLSDKLSIPASQLTRDNISARLGEKNIPQETINKVIDILDHCEMARYTPDSGSMESMTSVLQETENVMASLD